MKYLAFAIVMTLISDVCSASEKYSAHPESCRVQMNVGDERNIRRFLMSLSPESNYLTCPFSPSIDSVVSVYVVDDRKDLCNISTYQSRSVTISNISKEESIEAWRVCSPIFSSTGPRRWARERLVYVWDGFKGRYSENRNKDGMLLNEAQIEAFVARSGMPFSRFGRMGDRLCFEVPKADGRPPSEILETAGYVVPDIVKETQLSGGTCEEAVEFHYGESAPRLVDRPR